jgi:hypothetical protein
MAKLSKPNFAIGRNVVRNAALRQEEKSRVWPAEKKAPVVGAKIMVEEKFKNVVVKGKWF